MAREQSLLLIVPESDGRQLTPTLTQSILHDVEGGLPLLLDGPSPLAEALGVKATGGSGEMKDYDWEDY